ncbi:MAG: energy transducer TonB [Cyclobacteriaceae bacterium]|nr:energy transducer TonB [Cyclobacteriaceae bacterium]
MEAKKYNKADINRYRVVFFNIGLIISLGLTYTAFEWKFYDEGVVDATTISADTFDEIIEIPPTEQPPPPPPELKNITIVEIEDVAEIEDELEISFDIEMTDDMTIEASLETLDLEEDEEEEVSDEIFLIVEEQPQPKGGMSTFYQYINSTLKYPSQALRMGLQGKVFVQFVIEKDGSITQVTVIRGIDSSCNEEAIRVVSGAPAWKPGKQRGKPVRVKMVLPISFKLR